MPAFCETEDVRKVLQKSPEKFGDKQLSTDIVEAAIESVSGWLAAAGDVHFYDSGGTASDLVDTSPATAEGIIESVASTPHRQSGQLFHSRKTGGALKYPNTKDGTHVRVQLPAYYIESIDRLAVRDRDGDVTDWVAASDKAEGRGEDYYLQVDASDAYGRSYLYLRADSIGPRRSYEDLLTIDITYGRDEAEQPWPDVRRGVAALAGAQVIADDDVIAALPDNGSLIGVDTQVQQLINIALEDPGTLSPYMPAPVE
jgi:hypothetical protein